MKIIALFVGMIVVPLASAADFWPWKKSEAFSGTLELTEHLVGARTQGRIAKLYVGDGDPVKRGQLLAILDRYDQASRDYNRVLELYQNGGTNKQALEQAGLSLEDQKVVSPVNGVVLTKIRESGEVLSAGNAVFDLGDRSNIWIRIFISEALISRVKMGQPATISIDGITQPFQAHVTYVSPTAEFTPRNVQSAEERVTQMFAVKVTLDAPPDFLRPGVSGNVSLDLREVK